jgi:hypothetical protein
MASNRARTVSINGNHLARVEFADKSGTDGGEGAGFGRRRPSLYPFGRYTRGGRPTVAYRIQGVFGQNRQTIGSFGSSAN